jgi:hypothetical protein
MIANIALELKVLAWEFHNLRGSPKNLLGGESVNVR